MDLEPVLAMDLAIVHLTPRQHALRALTLFQVNTTTNPRAAAVYVVGALPANLLQLRQPRTLLLALLV